MKKDYSSPKALNIKLESEPLMNITSGETDNVGTGSGSATDKDPEVAGKHRGDWGNLWQ